MLVFSGGVCFLRFFCYCFKLPFETCEKTQTSNFPRRKSAVGWGLDVKISIDPTSLKFNIEPQTGKKEIPSGSIIFSGSMLNFRSVPSGGRFFTLGI